MKHLGKCPWCGENVRAVVIEENYIRRDLCECPKCGEKILICRTPGCTNYAKGGDFWDDELCPDCTSGAGSIATGVATTVLIGKLGDIFTKK